MKTLHIISTAILLSLTSISFGNEGDKITNTDEGTAFSIVIVNIEKPTCNGANNGSITAEAKGGIAPYEYNWNTFPVQKTEQASNLASGTYFIQVTDATGAVIFRSVKIEDPNSSVLTAVTHQQSRLDITASVSGENGPFTYQLNEQLISNSEAQDLPVGIHKLVITDNNQCQMIQYIQVFEIAVLPELIKPNEVILAKKERTVKASNLIPTKTTAEIGNEQNLVTVSGH